MTNNTAPRCQVCHDTGSKSRNLFGDLDCTACEAATERAALNTWAAKHPKSFVYSANEMAAWLIYQHGKQIAADEALKLLPIASEPVADPVANAAQGELTDDQLTTIAADAVKSGRLSWLGYSLDEEGKYTIPVLSISDLQLMRAAIAASGVNAGLVEALKQCLIAFDNIEVPEGGLSGYEWISYAETMANEALAAAALAVSGVEVGHG